VAQSPAGNRRAATPMRVEFSEYQLDTETRTLQREGRRIPVQSKAFDQLAYQIERRERVVSSDELLDALWPGLHVTPAALSTAVQKARQVVGDDGEHQAVLHTEHGKGFRFVAEVTDLSPPETAQPIQDTAQPTPETDRPVSAGAAQIPLIAELKRRNVFRVAAAYGIVAWLLVEAASVVLPALRLPEWTLTLLVFLVVAGFPLALILAWAFELTPEGIKRETAVDRAESITRQTGRKLDFAIIGLLAVALVFVALDHYILKAEPERAEVAAEQAPAAEPVALPVANEDRSSSRKAA
jgi:DNA-binding winged helix-turn-helix (wHTH) protein